MSRRLSSQTIERIAGTVPTPFYLYDRLGLEDNFRALAGALPAKAGILYSMKANPNPAIVALFAGMGAGVEVASGGELAIALAAGAAPQSITFAGPGKTTAELKVALEAGILAVSVESRGQIENLDRLCTGSTGRIDVLLRINPVRPVPGARISMGGGSSPFGIDEEQVEDVLQGIRRTGAVRCIGLHVYAGTQVLDSHGLQDYFRRTIEFGLRMASAHGLSILNVGGGYGVPYHPDQSPLDLAVVSEGFSQAASRPDVRILTESGRFLTADAGYYVTRIVDMKESRGRRFVVLDGGTHQHPGSGGIGRLVRRNPVIRVVGRSSSSETCRVAVVGPLCVAADRIAEDLEIPADTRVGDLVVIEGSGAYCRSASPLGFLSHDWPAEYLCTNDRDSTCISPRMTAMDLYRFQSRQRPHES